MRFCDVKPPNQHVCYLKALKCYKKGDKFISRTTLDKFSQHLWYIFDEIVKLLYFDHAVEEQIKPNIVIK